MQYVTRDGSVKGETLRLSFQYFIMRSSNDFPVFLEGSFPTGL